MIQRYWDTTPNDMTPGVSGKWVLYSDHIAEVEALKTRLKIANDNMEEMERELYLKLNALERENEALKAENAKLQQQINEAIAGLAKIGLKCCERIASSAGGK